MHDPKQQFIDLYWARRAEGAKNADIAGELGIKPGSLMTRLRRYGVKAELDSPTKGPIVHGTYNGYIGHGCRCDQCKKANRLKYREQRSNRLERMARGEATFWHNASGYANWGCRCEICATAWADKMRHDYSRRKRIPSAELAHGRIATYSGYGCRCDACRAAASEYFRKRAGTS